MAKKDNRIVIKDMAPSTFARFLNKMHACDEAKAYCKGKTLKEAFTRTTKGQWISLMLNSVHWYPEDFGGEEKVTKKFGTATQWQTIRDAAPSIWTFATATQGYRNRAKYYRQHYAQGYRNRAKYYRQHYVVR